MKYKNTKTGQVVITTGRVSGDGWVPMEGNMAKPIEAPIPPKQNKTKKKPAGGGGA